jgi:uncharacterized damage-inducible protein DinB
VESTEPSGRTEREALLSSLGAVRRHIFEAIEGLEEGTLRRGILPSGWTCLGLVNHLSLDVERFWFQAVLARDEAVIAELLGSSESAWKPGDDESAEHVLDRYRSDIERSDAILSDCSLDAPPAWWPEDLFGSWRLSTAREVVLHVISETATHAGHLDSARELVDGKLHLVLG